MLNTSHADLSKQASVSVPEVAVSWCLMMHRLKPAEMSCGSQGLESVVAKIIEQPTTLEQRDRQRKTPLQIARRRAQQAVVDLLLQAGATDTKPPPGDWQLREYSVPASQRPHSSMEAACGSS